MMKKITTLLLWSILCCIRAEAQDTVFAPVGAEWHYISIEKMYNIWAGEQIPDMAWNDHVTSVGDTLIDGHDSRILEIVRKYRYGVAGPVLTANPLYEFVYDNPDTTFYYDKDSLRFLPLYIWNVQAGDTVSLPHLNHITHQFSFVIDSVAEVLYDNTYLKTYYTSSYISESDGYGILNWGGYLYYDNGIPTKTLGFYAKKLGGSKSLFPSRTAGNQDGASQILTPAGPIACYKDTAVELHLSLTYSCDSVPKGFYTSIDYIARLKNGISVFPNPASDAIRIRSASAFETDSRLEIRDITGREMLPALTLSKKKEVYIDVSQWPAGIYLMQFKSGSDTYYHRVSVRR